MPRLVFCFAVCLPSFVAAQLPHKLPVQHIYSGSATSSPVQVVYVLNDSTLTTYHINPQTLQATQVGTLTVPQSAFPGFIAFSPDDRFLYYSVQPTAQQGTKVYTYATNASGVPQAEPVQQLNANGLFSGPIFDPNAPFAYAVLEGTQGPLYTAYFLERFAFDAATGVLSQPETLAKYELEGSGEFGQNCGLELMGFNPGASELYDQIYCTSRVGPYAEYNQRAINSQTGALGPDVQIYSWATGTYVVENLQFVNNLMFDFKQQYQTPPGRNFIDIYQVQPNVAPPIVKCTGAQMQACADFIVGFAHPSGQYVFLLDSDTITEVGQVDLSAQDIYGPVSSIPYQVEQFSPDGSIAYAINEVGEGSQIEIYGFNVSNGEVTQGGTISVPLDYDSWWAAERR